MREAKVDTAELSGAVMFVYHSWALYLYLCVGGQYFYPVSKSHTTIQFGQSVSAATQPVTDRHPHFNLQTCGAGIPLMSTTKLAL